VEGGGIAPSYAAIGIDRLGGNVREILNGPTGTRLQDRCNSVHLDRGSTPLASTMRERRVSTGEHQRVYHARDKGMELNCQLC
jgi:hypothetical protein